MEDKYISYKTLTKILDMPAGTAYSLVSQRKIPHVRLGKRLVRFKLADILKWAEDNAVEVKAG